jgi:hypothetical protein
LIAVSSKNLIFSGEVTLRDRQGAKNGDNVLSFYDWIAAAFKNEATPLGEDARNLSRGSVGKGAGRHTALHQTSDLGLRFSCRWHGYFAPALRCETTLLSAHSRFGFVGPVSKCPIRVLECSAPETVFSMLSQAWVVAIWF